MTVKCIYWPCERELKFFKRCIWVTMWNIQEPKEEPSQRLLEDILEARHSPIRGLNFGFLFEGIPSNIATHLTRHVHAVPFVSSLRNDRQEWMDGDAARRDTPVDMIYYCNAEELMTIANKRLCSQAAAKTREAVRMMCDAAIEKMPELKELLVPACEYNGFCHEIKSCGRRPKRSEAVIVWKEGAKREATDADTQHERDSEDGRTGTEPAAAGKSH